MERVLGKSMVLAAALVVFLASFVMAQTAKAPDYPKKDITVIVPLRAGGGYDITARMLAPYIEKYLPKKVNFIVQNVTGAGGRIGTFQLYDAEPDGYTIGLLDAQIMLLAEALGQTGSRNPLQLTYLGRAAHQPFLVTLTAQRFKSFQDVKGKPIRLSCVAINQAGAILVFTAAGAKPQIVLYEGSNEGLLAVARGETDASSYTFATSLTQVQAMKGKLIAALVTDSKRSPEAPDVPTPYDLGLKIAESDLAACAGDYILAAPPKLPPEVQKILVNAVQKAINDKDFLAQMDKAKYMPNALSAEDTLKLVTNSRKVYSGMKKLLQPG